MSAEDAVMSRDRRSRLLPLAIMIAALAAFWGLRLDRYLSVQAAVDHRDALLAFVRAHALTALLAFALVYALAVALSFPGASILTIIGGFLFGTWLGGTLALVAATAGATIVFLTARTSIGAGLARRAGPVLARLSAGFERNAFAYLVALRLAPVFPFWLVNLAPALFGMRLRDYVLATAVGIVPGTFAFAAIGAGLDGAIAAQRPAFEACVAAGRLDCRLAVDAAALVSPEIAAALAVLALASLLPLAVKAVRARAWR